MGGYLGRGGKNHTVPLSTNCSSALASRHTTYLLCQLLVDASWSAERMQYWCLLPDMLGAVDQDGVATASSARQSVNQSVSGPIGTQEIMVRTWQRIGCFTL